MAAGSGTAQWPEPPPGPPHTRNVDAILKEVYVKYYEKQAFPSFYVHPSQHGN